MIIPVLGAPGTGKTTLCQEMTRRFGTPHFEMSWMPEFMTRNGIAIPYTEDERIAVCGLVAIAKVYSDEGHKVVLISDFRNEVLPLGWRQLGEYPYRVVRLYSSVDSALAVRITDPTRPSGYRDVAAAQVANRIIQAMNLGDSLDIDVSMLSVEHVIEQVRTTLLIPGSSA